MLSRSVIAVFILLCNAGFVRTDSENDGYSGEVAKFLSDLMDNDSYYKDFVETAYRKMEDFKGETPDRYYAIAIINLYTQDSDFYTNLNREMRNNYPSSTNIWRRAGDLINRGLDILGPTIHKLSYRGCSKLDVLPVAGKEYRFNQITSTSLDKSVSVDFISCPNGFLFEIKDVYGVLVQDYSDIGGEEEVLVKSNYVYNVTRGPVKEYNYNVYYLDGQPEINCNRRRKRDINGNYDYCINSANKTGIGIVSLLTANVVLVLLFWQ